MILPQLILCDLILFVVYLHGTGPSQNLEHVEGKGGLSTLNGLPMGTFFVWSGGFLLTWNTTGWHDMA